MPVCLFWSRSDRVGSGWSRLQILAGCQETDHLVQVVLGKAQIRAGCTRRDGTAAAVILRQVVREVAVVIIYRIHVDVTVVSDRRHRHVAIDVALLHERRSAGMRVNRRRRAHGHVRATTARARTTRTVHFTLVGTLRTKRTDDQYSSDI